MNRSQTGATPKTKVQLDANLRRLDVSLKKLGEVQPPPAKSGQFHDMLRRLGRIVSFSKANDAKVVYWSQRIAKSSSRSVFAQYESFAGPLIREIPGVITDIHSLGLRSCGAVDSVAG
jgi:hypothetical protein